MDFSDCLSGRSSCQVLTSNFLNSASLALTFLEDESYIFLRSVFALLTGASPISVDLEMVLVPRQSTQ